MPRALPRSERLLLALAVLLPASPAVAQDVVYPQTKRVDHVDVYHGDEVEDPYRWLEGNAKEEADVGAWVEAQNEVTFDYLETIPQRERIARRLTDLWNFERISGYSKAGGRYFYDYNDGLQSQNVKYVKDSADAEPRVLLDPNGWSEDGTVTFRGSSVSDDGRYIAYGVAEAGSDWNLWRIRDIDTGEDLPETLRWIKFSGAAWTPDGKGFFYGRYDEPDAGNEYQSVNEFQKLYYHRLNTPQSEDVLVYHRPDEPKWGFGPTVTEDGRWLVITVWKGTGEKNLVLVKDLNEPYGMPVELIGEWKNEYAFVGNDGSTFFFRTDLDATRKRLIAIDLRHPEPERWREIIGESADTLTGVSLVGNQFVANYLKDARTAIRVFHMDGTPLREVNLPSIGSAGGFGGKRTDTETFYGFSSFTVPSRLYRYDLLTGRSDLIWQAKVDFDPDAYEVKQVFYTSTDGTRVPMFICHRKGLTLDGSNPTLLYGYGGFNVSMTPYFSISRMAWMEMGGVYAVANLRGGGEYGEEWHQAGTKLEKQNVFDDFISAAEWLIDSGYTRPEKLAIHGGSNGGLLVGACMTQRPELFGAALPAVGVLDMLRFHKFTIGWAWVDDYGSSDDPAEYEALKKYSPYHNVKHGTAYPPTLITTGDTDDRVVPGHSFKFAAALQYAQSGDSPVLIRIETRAGHGAGKPTEKIIAETADRWAFLVKTLGMTPDLPGGRR